MAGVDNYSYISWFALFYLTSLFSSFLRGRGDLNVLLPQTLSRPLTASWRLPVWSLCRWQVSNLPVTSVASTKPSSATGGTAGVWTRPMGIKSLEPSALDRPVAVKLSLLVRQDNWLWIQIRHHKTLTKRRKILLCFMYIFISKS